LSFILQQTHRGPTGAVHGEWKERDIVILYIDISGIYGEICSKTVEIPAMKDKLREKRKNVCYYG